MHSRISATRTYDVILTAEKAVVVLGWVASIYIYWRLWLVVQILCDTDTCSERMECHEANFETLGRGNNGLCPLLRWFVSKYIQCKGTRLRLRLAEEPHPPTHTFSFTRKETRGKFSKWLATQSNFCSSCVNWLLNYQAINWLFLAVVVGGHLSSSVTQPLTQLPHHLKLRRPLC